VTIAKGRFFVVVKVGAMLNIRQMNWLRFFLMMGRSITLLIVRH